MSRFLEKKTYQSKINTKTKSKKIGYSDLLLDQYRSNKKMKSPYCIEPEGPQANSKNPKDIVSFSRSPAHTQTHPTRGGSNKMKSIQT